MSGIDERAVAGYRFAGNWNEGFDDQGDNGNLWSSSANPDDADYAYSASFNSGFIYPGDIVNRTFGVGFRCLL